MGTLLDFHRPACMTDARSIFRVNRPCVAPTLTECPLTPLTSFGSIFTSAATRLKVSARKDMPKREVSQSLRSWHDFKKRKFTYDSGSAQFNKSGTCAARSAAYRIENW